MPVDFARRVASKRRVRAVLWRSVAFILIFGVGVGAFVMGTAVSERPNLPDEGILTQIYYALGLFVLGGLDLGTPINGPMVGRVLLWFAYFLAPAITATAVVEGLLRVINPDYRRVQRLRNHIVIAGCGQLTLLYLDRLRELYPDKPVVVVESEPDKKMMAGIRDRYDVYVVPGDIRYEAVIETLSLLRAERILLLTQDDFANLDAAAKIVAAAPKLADRIVVHVADIGFMRSIAKTDVANNCTVFNSHQIAASHLVKSELRTRFLSTESADIVVIAGFGRFGQSVLDELQESGEHLFNTVVIVDCEADLRALEFDEQVGFMTWYQHSVIDGDLRSPEVWRQIDRDFDFATHAPAFVLGSGDDGVNVRTAVWASAQYPNAYVVARSFSPSLFIEEVAKEAGFHSFSVAELVTQSMPKHWFRKGKDRGDQSPAG